MNDRDLLKQRNEAILQKYILWLLAIPLLIAIISSCAITKPPFVVVAKMDHEFGYKYVYEDGRKGLYWFVDSVCYEVGDTVKIKK